MSWKLAELRWRDQVGLYESRWEKRSGILPVDRRRAIEAFGGRKDSSRGRSVSVRDAKEHSAGGGLGIPFRIASPAPRLSLDFTGTHPSPPLPPSKGTRARSPSLAYLLQTSLSASNQPQVSQSISCGAIQDQRRSVTRSHSCSALSASSSHPRSPTFDHSARQTLEANKQVFFFDDQQSRIASQDSAELEHLLGHQDSGFSSSNSTERVLSHASPEFSQLLERPDAQEQRQPHHDTLDPGIVEVFDHYLEFEGAAFKLLNNRDSDHLWDIGSPQDSSEAHWASTISKHRSTSYLIPINTMSDDVQPVDRHRILEHQVNPDDEGRKARTPKRRTTPIYDDYQTAVNMIRSGTPKSRSSSAGQDHGPTVEDELPEMPKTPISRARRRSYSLADVSRKLSASYSDPQSAAPGKPATLRNSVTTPFSAEENRASIPVFPLRPRDSDEENERVVASGTSQAIEEDDNPAGIDLGHEDIPLRNMGLSQVRSRTRGEPISSQEIHASSADFEYVDEPSAAASEVTSVTPTRISPATDTSTIGNIVNQYAGDTATKPVGGAEPTEIGNTGMAARNILQARSRAAVDAGPPPSWALPPAPPTRPALKSKRRNSSGMLSSPAEYGNTSQLLEPSSRDTGARNDTSDDFSSSKPSSTGMTALKVSELSSDLVGGATARSESAGVDEDLELDRSCLSHVSEESTVPSTDSGWAAAVRYAGLHVRDANNDINVNTGEVRYRRAWSPTHRRTYNIDTSVFASDMRQHPSVEIRPGLHFPSVGQILEGNTDADTIASADDCDWETVHSRSQSNVQLTDDQKEGLDFFKSGKIPSMESLSFSKDPVSTWDPLSTKTKRFREAENDLGKMLKSHKESTKGKSSHEVGVTGANNTNAPGQSRRLPEDSVYGIERAEHVQQQPTDVKRDHQQSPTSKPQTTRYRHPTPLEERHKNPFLEDRPVIHPLSKTHSCSSTDNMYRLPNNNIEIASSAGSARGGSHACARAGSLINEEKLALIDLYDPDTPRVRKVFPDGKLNLDRNRALGPAGEATKESLGRFLCVFATVCYWFGGFILMEEMARGGGLYTFNFMQFLSETFDMPVVGSLRGAEVALAKKWHKAMRLWTGVIAVFCVAVLLWAAIEHWA